MNENEIQIKEIESKIAFVLGTVYTHIPWGKIRVKSSYKFFMDRIRASSSSMNFKEFLDVLCRKVNVEMVKIDTDILDLIDEENALAMRLLRKETLYIGNLAIEVAQTIREQKKEEKNPQTTLI